MNEVQVTLPDGSEKQFPEGATALTVAENISSRLAADALAAKIDERLSDVYWPLPEKCRLEIVTSRSPEALDIYRHSCAHLMANAVKELFPDAKIAIGPVIEDGFYYDFDREEPFTPEDLEKIENRMAEIASRDTPIRREELPWEDAKALFDGENEPYKSELAYERGQSEPVSIYRQGDFNDFCRGPHLPSTGRIKPGTFKLLSVAGAYWKGDEHNKMLQRIYATAFLTRKELEDHLGRLEEARERDHRKLGKELGLFLFHPWAPASPFFTPKGALVYNGLVDLMRGYYRKYDYQEVVTPQVFDVELWKRSGHYDHYRDNMFLSEIDGREFGVKPMNCPGHCLMFESETRSYRDLPLRIADFGRLHRYERSGVTQGLTRVRSFSQDDAHIFCRPGQIGSEIGALIDLVQDVFAIFGFTDLQVFLSTRPGDSVGSDAIWEQAEKALKSVLSEREMKFTLDPGEGVFYGPKIDFKVKDAIGRPWQLATIQLDFNLPERFGLTFVSDNNTQERPVMIHRAILGSIERFMGVLIEHYNGAFPLWLAPVQVRILPIADRHAAYAEKVAASMRTAGIRVEVDARPEKTGYKIRDAQMMKIPYMLILGDREMDAGTVSVRSRSGGDRGAAPLDEFISMVLKRIETMSNELDEGGYDTRS
ncbi:MAG: threonine--tRNA ligase [Acidobacteriota bacterium]